MSLNLKLLFLLALWNSVVKLFSLKAWNSDAINYLFTTAKMPCVVVVWNFLRESSSELRWLWELHTGPVHTTTDRLPNWHRMFSFYGFVANKKSGVVGKHSSLKWFAKYNIIFNRSFMGNRNSSGHWRMLFFTSYTHKYYINLFPNKKINLRQLNVEYYIFFVMIFKFISKIMIILKKKFKMINTFHSFISVVEVKKTLNCFSPKRIKFVFSGFHDFALFKCYIFMALYLYI